MLEIKKEKDGSKITISLAGRIDSMTSAKLEESLAGEFDGMDEVILDMSEVSYISSAGLRVLLGARKAVGSGASFAVENANEDLRGIFEVTKLMQLLNVK